MISIRRVPSYPLNAYIDCFYYRNAPMPYPREKILPIRWLDLKVNFGGALRAYETEHAASFVTCSDSWCVGLQSKYHIVDWPSDLQFIMVDFKPGGAYPFLQIPLFELHNQVVSLDAIWGRRAVELRERLYAAPTIHARLMLLEQMLLARLCDKRLCETPAPQGLKAVQYAIVEIARHHGAISIRALSDRIGISQKHLITQFKMLVGGTPKALARTYRFRYVLRSIDVTQPVDWTWVAHQCGYYDQPHFNKDFEAFTGHTPTDYLRLRRRVYDEHPEHVQSLLQLPSRQLPIAHPTG